MRVRAYRAAHGPDACHRWCGHRCIVTAAARLAGLGYSDPMTSLSYRGHRFPAAIIQHAIWLYLRFTLSYRDVEELLAERGLDLSYETVRRWVLKFGPLFARVCVGTQLGDDERHPVRHQP